jgi:type IV secretion system protein TrbI
MVQSLQLGEPETSGQDGMRRLNRLPIIVAIVIVALFFAVIVFGLSARGLRFGHSAVIEPASNASASTFADQLKKGVSDGIIGDPQQASPFQPAPPAAAATPPTRPTPTVQPAEPRLAPDTEWLARLQREDREAFIRERQRQRMQRLQAQSSALDSPLKVDISELGKEAAAQQPTSAGVPQSPGGSGANTGDLYAAALAAGASAPEIDPNGQVDKEQFFNRDIKELGYLPTSVTPPLSPYELKRGSVIPATLITGLNSDLPGRIIAQVSQNVFDSATGYRLLIPQGAKLLGRYDAKVSFGQERVLVVWTDLIFPNGSTLQIGGMAGTDAEGYGGFSDKVDRHLWRTFGSAALVALIGIDMSIPEGSTLSNQTTASDAARRNFAEVFGQAAQQTISKNLNVQPTIRIRPGYNFNVLVDQDVVFPSAYTRS